MNIFTELLYYPICVCAFVLAVGALESGCKDGEHVIDVEIVNLNDTVNFTLHDKKNLSNYEISVVYSWEVNAKEDSLLDGFVWCFKEVLDITIRNDYKFQEHYYRDEDYLEDKVPYSHCREYLGKPFHVHDANGSYVTCAYPCEGFIPSCPFSRNNFVCPLLGGPDDCHVLPRESRSVTRKIAFGRKYKVRIYPYVGHAINHNQLKEGDTLSIFCSDHLIGNEQLPPDQVLQFCKSEQALSHTGSSPPTGFEVIDEIPNYFEKTVSFFFRWKAPHDTQLNASVSSYLFASTSGKTVRSLVKSKTPDEELVNPYYSITLVDVPMGERFQAAVTPGLAELEDQDCGAAGKCKILGSRAILEIDTPRFDSCTYEGNYSFCHPLATVQCNNTGNATELANCSCPLGYVGDGRNPLTVKNAKGCEKSNPCQVTSENKRFCAPEAVCVEAAPPSNAVTCLCPSGFVGDGTVSGGGCKTNTEANSNIAIIVGGLVGSLVGLCVLAVLIMTIRKYWARQKRAVDRRISAYVSTISETNPNSSVNGIDVSMSPAHPIVPRRWEIERSAITLQNVIGRGNFGVVHKATMTLNGIEQTVAVKSLTGMYSTNHFDDFLHEMNLLVNLGSHENVLKLLRVCITPPPSDAGDILPPLMVTEYMIHGDLLHFLWDSREASNRELNPIYNFTESRLYIMGRQVAHGLEFLSYKKVIHGDVAARNMLVGEDLKIKISDFGLANDVYRYGFIKCATERRVPFKWISPERMQGGGTPITWRSDVWSFGILLYEMVTLGATPYPGMEPCTIYQQLQGGYRIPQPLSCNDHLYQIMLSCWKWRASERLTFGKLKEKLDPSTYLANSTCHDTPIEVQDPVNHTMYERDLGRRDSPFFSENETERQRNGVTNHSSDNGNLANGHAATANSHNENRANGSVINNLCLGDIAVNVEPND